MTKPIRFQRDYFGRIDEVRRQLRSNKAHTIGTFIGTVERLDGEMGEDGRRSGEVIIALLLEGESIRVKTNLTANEYEKAHQAHITESAYVQISGKIHPGRSPQSITEITRFKLIHPSLTNSED
ncbi:hypothetical protein CCP3SC1AL1_640013 [Gammaproteobacteria bacterium]